MKLKIALCLATALSATPAVAQTAPSTPAPQASPAGATTPPQTTEAAPDNSGLADIVVTAQRRSENLQNVPVAVSAVTATALASTGIRDVVDLKLAVPTLNVTNSNGYVTSSLRGIGSNGVGPGIENPIATYIDGVYLGSQGASLLSLNNVSQIDVLKGPQGTLFGRNATGGLIQITTRTPTSKPSVDFSVGYGNYDTVTANGYVSGGIGDVFAADLAVTYTYMGDGYGRNRTTGLDVYRVNHDFAARSKWVLTPSSATTFTLIGDYSSTRNSMNAFRTFPGTVNGFVAGRGREPDYGYDNVANAPNYVDSVGGGVSLRWDQEIGGVKFSSITAYRRFRAGLHFDYDGTEQNLEQIDFRQLDKQFSQEFQLTSKSSGPFTWVAGAYYFDASAEYAPFVLTANDLGAVITLRNRQRTQSIAGYAQGTLEIVDGLKLTLGGRYTSETRKAVDGSQSVFVIPLGFSIPTAFPDQKKTFNKFTFRGSLDYRFSPAVLAYASFNRGFKSGGYNTGAPGTAPFSPEQLDAYEIGLKTDLFDRRVRLNLAGFYYDYSNIQIQQLNAGAITVINGAKARDYGIDADLTIKVADGLTFNSGLGWISPKFTAFPNCPTSTPLGGTPSTVASCTGKQLPLAAKFTANVGLTYSAEIGSSKLDLNGSLYYNSGFFPESDNAIRQPEYATLGASAKYTFAGGFSISAFGKNLTNQRVINFETTIPNGTHTGFYQAPRTYGVAIGYKF